MDITACSKDDFDQIVSDLSQFWEHDRAVALHHPTLINEFAGTAYVVKEGEKVIAYMFAFLSQSEPAGYVHLLVVRRGYRKRGLGRKLYAHFEGYARSRGCTRLKSMTNPVNEQSIAFHKSIGMRLLGEPNAEGIPVVRDYAGPGRDRVVFEKEI
jgi:GNAT superfamily N-acetyltransferase